jgi:6-phosphogluconolactonase
MDELIFVGTYSEPILFGTGQVLQGKGGGIHAFRFDPATGAATPGPVTPVRNPSYLAFHPRLPLLYAVNEFKEYQGKPSGAVSAFRYDATGALALLSMQASEGTDPCHLVADATGRCVLVANFASGSVSVLPVDEAGALGPASCTVQHEGSSIDPVRQNGPHAHAVALDATNRYALVPELGGDCTKSYVLDAAAARIVPHPTQPSVAVAPGAGPRQMAMHPGGRFAYLINELNSTVDAYGWDGATGTLTPLQTVGTLPADFTGRSTCAEVQVSPDGRFLYGSNRGHDSLAIFAIDPGSGRLTPAGHVSTGGHIPRNFDIHPSGDILAAANQDTDDVVFFRVDRATGGLTPTGTVLRVGTPVCVRFRGPARSG